ncbi:MAG: hypothetical protein LBN39_03535 [Planctomycetaceae bacterium]|jgi:hypothetical protein|nr:hypothetical protein [Planctomycetaceae bacterium]
MSCYRFLILILLLTLTGNAGCEVLPVTRFKPTLHNPLPQLRNVAVVPFYNATGNPNVDGRRFATCFANELQRVPGFNVISNNVVEKTMLAHNIYRFENVDDVRYLAQLLKVDSIVIGKIHYLNDHYPPKVKFETEWYAVNPYFHPIPAGRGLPWGTKHEEFIPDKLLLEAEMELASAQLETQTPKYEPVKREPAEEQKQQFNPGSSAAGETEKRTANRDSKIMLMSATLPNNLGEETENETELDGLAKYRQQRYMNQNLALTGVPYIPEAEPYKAEDQKRDMLLKQPQLEHPFQQGPWQSETAQKEQNPWSAQNQYLPYQHGQLPVESGVQNEELRARSEHSEQDALNAQLPPDWPDPRGFIPESPVPERPKGEVKNDGPIITHISMYNGNDSEFMQALQDYDFLFRDDKRLAGKESILNNGTEFISFCCRMHIWEIFTARGGAGEAVKVKRFYKIWKGGERPY